MKEFTSGSTWYYINHKGKIVEFTIHSGMSPIGAEILAKVYVIYSDWSEANSALTQFNKHFTTFTSQD